MKLIKALASLLLVAGALNAMTAAAAAAPAPGTPGTFKAGKGQFLLNDEPFVVKAAELHYPRIPRPYWEQRIEMCKALGMNTVCLYVFWNAHEPSEGVYDFEGQNDLAHFIRLCDKHGMKVILRPGPYVCAEWEMGGLPWWLLKKKDIALRENDPYFLERVAAFENAVAQQVGDLTIDKGGPIIMIQVENEYGSYGEDKEYVSNIRDIVRSNYPQVTLFQCDWSSNFTLNALDDMVWTMNFGTGANIDDQFRHLKELRPDSPLMCSEFWSGWFDKWGANHETRPADDMIAGIDEMLSKGISFSLYMTHGGTNWGHWAGANSPGFAPDVTSYDYDAPIDEAGNPTPKYWALRQTLARYPDAGQRSQSRVPSTPKAIEIKAVTLNEVAPLFDNLPQPVRHTGTITMEDADQGFGSILYRTTLPTIDEPSLLTVTEPHDYAQIFINGRYQGTLDRRNGDRQLRLPAVNKGDTLDILVEAMGRINFGRAIKDFKGITEGVSLTIDRDSRPFTCQLKGWDTYLLPDELDFYTSMNFVATPSAADSGARLERGVYRGSFNLNRVSDTYLDFSTWGKGLVYVNGHPMGRIWEIGPQQTLYMPGCWLKKGENEVVVFDIMGPRATTVQGLKTPIIDQLLVARPLTHREDGEALDLTASTPVLTGAFAPGNGWQEIKLDTNATGRYVALEALDAHDGGDRAAIAELYLLDPNGERLSREPWTIYYADSEEVDRKNCSGDKIFDLQESTYWRTVKGTPFPHALVIDLGADRTISAIQYLPRMETNAPQSIKGFKLYVSDTAFPK